MARPSFRRSSGFMRVKKPVRVSYIIRSTPVAIATETAVNYSMLLNSDSPDKSIVSNFTSTIAQVENGTKILKKGSFVTISMIAITSPVICAIWVYLNSKGQVIAPTDSTDFSEGPQTDANAELRAKTIYYRHIPLSTTEYRTVRIPLGSRRNNMMLDPTSILAIEMHCTGGSGSMEYLGYGRIRTLEG